MKKLLNIISAFVLSIALAFGTTGTVTVFADKLQNPGTESGEQGANDNGDDTTSGEDTTGSQESSPSEDSGENESSDEESGTDQGNTETGETGSDEGTEESGETIESGSEDGQESGAETSSEDAETDDSSDDSGATGEGSESSEEADASQADVTSESDGADDTDATETEEESESETEEELADESDNTLPEGEDSAEGDMDSEEEESLAHSRVLVWHENWLGRGPEFTLKMFRLIEPVYGVIEAEEARVYRLPDSSETNLTAVLNRGAVIVKLMTIDADWCFVETTGLEGAIVRGYLASRTTAPARNAKFDPELVEVLGESNFSYRDCKYTTLPELTGRKVTTWERADLLNEALKYLGNPYVWGGESLTRGADCSGYVRQLYLKLGVTLPRCSYQQCYTGQRIAVADAMPGDLIFYSSNGKVHHVMICLTNDGEGNISVVHARNWYRGIEVSQLRASSACWAVTLLERADMDYHLPLCAAELLPPV